MDINRTNDAGQDDARILSFRNSGKSHPDYDIGITMSKSRLKPTATDCVFNTLFGLKQRRDQSSMREILWTIYSNHKGTVMAPSCHDVIRSKKHTLWIAGVLLPNATWSLLLNLYCDNHCNHGPQKTWMLAEQITTLSLKALNSDKGNKDHLETCKRIVRWFGMSVICRKWSVDI